MKTFVRLLALIIACLMCVVPFVACDDNGGSGSGNNGGGSNLINSEYDENGLLMDKLPTNLNYSGAEVNVLHWSDSGVEFEVESITGENVSDAVYERNLAIEDRLNVDLKFIGEPGSNTKRAAFVKRVQSALETGTHEFDIVASYSRTQGMLGVAGLLMDLNNLELDGNTNYLNFSMPWWPDDMLTSLAVGDSCFFLSGDISTNVLYNMTNVFYNKALFNNRFTAEAQAKGYETGVEMLYDLVYMGNKKSSKTTEKWTLDKMIELSNDFCEGVVNEGDVLEGTYGFVSIYFHLDGIYSGSNLRLVDQDEDDLLIISPDFGSAKTVALVKKLGDWIKTDVTFVQKSNSEFSGTGESYEKPFVKNKALFLLTRAHVARDTLSTTKALSGKYGVLPVPKYNDKQVNYYTCLGNPISIYGIYVDCVDSNDVAGEHLSMLTAVLECWGSEGYRKTTPEIFYVNMMVKYSDAPEDADMFQYVRNGIVFDLGRVFSDDLSYMSEMPSRVAANSASWSSSWGAYKKVLNAKMVEIVESFRAQGAF